MNDPQSELVGCVKALTMSATPAIQCAAVYKYFDPDAGFLHPLCTVSPGPGSRESILGIYRWYKILSPNVEAGAESLVYDDNKKIAYLDVVQTFHIFLSPFKPNPARFLVKLTLRQSQTDGKYYIAQQEDFYQPEDLLYLTVPFLAPSLVLLKRFAGQICCLNASVFTIVRESVHRGMAYAGFHGREKRVNENAHIE